ncbi:MAG TPA: SIMPL domain-containing protein [Flavitalea sp.]|nr:SIMPL domain-containing protein [Flavitalea sp.]
MKRMRLFIINLATVLLMFSAAPAQAQGKNFIDQPYVEVAGYSDTLVTPDLIYLSITLSEKDAKNKTSVEELETKMVETLKQLGIDVEKKLTVSDLLSNYKNYWLKKNDIIKSKSYELEVNTAAMTAQVLGALEDIGISRVDVARLEHSQMKTIENEVRHRAVLDAQTKARSLASALMQQVGPAIHITDLSVQNALQGRVSGLDEIIVAGYGISRKEDKKVEESVSFKKLKVSKSVNVAFILK